MKKILAALAVAMTALTACEKNALEAESAVTNPETSDPQQVVLTFSPYTMEAMTRGGLPGGTGSRLRSAPGVPRSVSGGSSAGRTRSGEPASIASIASRLDLWLYSDGTEAAAVHQTKEDPGFGTATLTLDKRKTYTLYAIAHRSTAATTLADGIASWKDEKVTHTFFFTQTFTPAETTALDCTMRRIVGNFQLDITDQIPDGVKTLRFEIPQTATRYDVTTQTNTNVTDRTTDISYGGTSATFNLYLLAQDDDTTPFDITVTALDQDGTAIQQRVFADVPVQNNHRTIYRGAFFTDQPMTAVFSADDWQEFGVTEF